MFRLDRRWRRRGARALNAGLRVAIIGFAVEAALAGDLYFGTSNVRGAWDTAGDLAAAVTGAVLIPWVWRWWRRRPDRG